MDQRNLYEQTITGKLEALPLPDMADAIWSRIESQLDIDMPTDEGPGDDRGPQSPPPRIIIGSIAFVFLMAFLSFFFLSKNNQHEQPFNEPVNPPTQTREQLINPGDPPQETNTKPERTTQSPGKILPPKNTGADSVAASAPVQALADSATVINNPPKVITPAPATIKQPDSLPGKKRKGVPGISDSDYRIVPTRD